VKTKKFGKNVTRLEKNRTILGIPYYLVVLALIIVPIFIMFLYSISTSTADVFTIGFTFANYNNTLFNAATRNVMFRSINMALLTTVVSLLIAYPLAYSITKMKASLQPLFIVLVNAPMWINMLLRTLALQNLFTLFAPDLLRTEFAVLIGMVEIFLPFMVLPIYNSLIKIDKSLYESSMDLGASAFTTFYKVTIPLTISGIMSGVLMVFLPAATTLVIPTYLGSSNNMHVGSLIERTIITQANTSLGAALAISLSLILLIMVFIAQKAAYRLTGVLYDEKI